MTRGILSGILAPSRHDRSNKAELLAWQTNQLRTTIADAYSNVRFWHDLLKEAGLKPDDIQSIGDLQKLPLVSKRDLTSRPLRERLSREPEKCIRITTSGTTGPPMAVYYSKEYVALTALYLHSHFRRWFGLKRVYKSVQLTYTSSSAHFAESRPTHNNRKGVGMKAAFFTRPIIERFAANLYFQNNFGELIPRLQKFAPDLIMGRANYLALLAQSVSREGSVVNPRCVIATGEPFDEPTRKHVQTALDCPAYQMYGSNETGPLALECKQRNGLHVFEDRVLLEIVDGSGNPVGPGEQGEIVVTELTNRAMPLIRYRMQDIGRASIRECACGVTLPMLDSVEGREIDLIHTLDGKTVSPKKVLTLMNEIEGLPKCQLVQQTPAFFTLRIFLQRKERMPISPVEQFLGILKMEIGSDPEIVLQPEVFGEVSAKVRPVISESPRITA